MIIISDTTPLISLLKIGRLELLHHLFDEIQIPYAVYRELTLNDKFRLEAIEILRAEYIQKVDVEDKKSVALLRRATGLDEGESEAIILSDEIKQCINVMKSNGRHISEQLYKQLMDKIGE